MARALLILACSIAVCSVTWASCVFEVRYSHNVRAPFESLIIIFQAHVDNFDLDRFVGPSSGPIERFTKGVLFTTCFTIIGTTVSWVILWLLGHNLAGNANML